MNETSPRIPTPTIQDLKAARQAFEESEPRDLFYRVATELVALALRGETKVSVPEALAVLLQTWNEAYYRFTPFDNQHFLDLEHVVAHYEEDLASLRDRSIIGFSGTDENMIKRLFGDFEEVLGPVGAAKSLHLLAPRFFPLWDRAIARAYGLALKERGKNAEQYCRFMEITKKQCTVLPREKLIGQIMLKALDEYNYCKYTKHWI